MNEIYAVLTLILIVALFVVFGGATPSRELRRAAEENRQHTDSAPIGGAFAGGL